MQGGFDYRGELELAASLMSVLYTAVFWFSRLLKSTPVM